MPDLVTAESFGERCWRVLLEETTRRGNARPPLPALTAAERQKIITDLHDAEMRGMAEALRRLTPAAGLHDRPRKQRTPKPAQQLLSDSIDPFGDKNHIPPRPEWVTAYSASLGYPLDGTKWCNGYASKGWIVSGKSRMVDWQAAVQVWRDRSWGADIMVRGGFNRGPSKPDKYSAPDGWQVVLRTVGERKDLDRERIEEFCAGSWTDVPLHLRDDVLKLKVS